MPPFAFGTTNWDTLPATEHAGEQGVARWRTLQLPGGIRVRRVDYSVGYVSDHWCEKGHVLYCLSGRLETRLRDGRQFTLLPGMSYQVGDGCDAHRSSAPEGAALFVVD